MDGKDAEEWLQGVFGKVEGMWSGVRGTLRQSEAANYVESCVQTIGTDVKSFCTEFIQEAFSSTPAKTVTNPVDDLPLVQTTEAVQSTILLEGVSNEITSSEIPRKVIVECILVKEETSVRVDEPDATVPASFDQSSCPSPSTEDKGKGELVSPGCQPEALICNVPKIKISTSFSESDPKNEKRPDTPITNFPYPGSSPFKLGRGCKNKECPNTMNRCALGTGCPALKALPISSTPQAASSSELTDACDGNSKLSDWDYIVAGSPEEVMEHHALEQCRAETMLGESCVMLHTSSPCPEMHPSGKKIEDLKKQWKLHHRTAKGNDLDSRTELSSLQSRKLELLEQEWELI